MLLRLLIVLGLVSACSPQPMSEAPRELHPWFAINRTFLLKSGGSFCGGVAVGSHTLATAAHCVPHSEVKFASKYEPDTWLSGEVMLRSESTDVATVRTPVPLRNWATLASLKTGDSVYSIHHGDGDPFQLQFGHVESEPRVDGVDWIQTDVPISPGASGCGLWDSDDRLTGIAASFKGSASFFAPARAIIGLSK